MAKRLDHHLATNQLHEKHQSAYRKYHSTETALLKVKTDVLEALDGSSTVALIMLDLSAAFETWITVFHYNGSISHKALALVL